MNTASPHPPSARDAASVACVRHVKFEDLGSFEAPLRARVGPVEYVDAPTASWREVDLLRPPLVVVLGGPIGVYETDAYPFLRAEVAAIAQRLRARRPTLGICLGCQLMAAALGAEVRPAPRKELGWAPVTLTAAGRRGPLRHLQDGGETPVLHWHGDTFDLPPNAEPLASTDACPHQAFAVGRHALGLQFHPEVTALGLERWFVGHAVEIAATPGASVPALRADARRHAAGLRARATALLSEWLDGALGAGGVNPG